MNRVLAVLLLLPAALTAQGRAVELAERLMRMAAPSGYEQAMADTLAALLPGATRDRAGNVLVVLGTGEGPRTLLACAMDEPGFVVAGIRADGYLTLRRAGPAPGRLADQVLEGQRVTIVGRKGPVPGVVGVRSIHLTRGRGTTDAPFTLDDAYVDIGAGSAAEVAGLGIEVLAPVTRAKAPQRYGDGLIAAPEAARRGACGALAAAALDHPSPAGSVVLAFLVEQGFTRRGLLTVLRERGPFDRTVLLEPDGATLRLGAADRARMGTIDSTGLAAQYRGSNVETVPLEEIGILSRDLRAQIGGGR